MVTTGAYNLSFQADGDEHDALERLVAHFLVSVIPAAGLEESVRCLYDIFEFHEEKLHALPTAPSTRHGTGTITRHQERSPFVVGE
jgi:hypothetical protein